MRLVLRAIVFLVIAGGLGLLAVAVFSDLPAPRREVTLPVDAK